ncbi:hypothetical protein RR42_m1946 [Cupriavidus basilensis]|uniref:Uncharacterized protein n=1 Tax=Cupriavidus basilensis TaxID=68895 RepID=A0A0C4YF04_9BURK|nr:hypothetical protein RR42_m1946 [Cupriavidus basilensis]
MRDTLAAYRAEAVKVHLASTAPTLARALRRARLRGLAAGTVGCGMAAAAWLLAAWLTGPAPEPLPSFQPVSMPGSMPVTSPARLPAPDAGLQAAVADRPEAVAAAVDSPTPAAPLPAPLRADSATASTATSPVAAPVERAMARRHSHADPVPPRQVAGRSAGTPVADDAGDNAGHSTSDSVGHSAGYMLAAPAYDAGSRPSAVAYLPPDSHFTLHGHSRLIDE